jgi:hypothetical protein
MYLLIQKIFFTWAFYFSLREQNALDSFGNHRRCPVRFSVCYGLNRNVKLNILRMTVTDIDNFICNDISARVKKIYLEKNDYY